MSDKEIKLSIQDFATAVNLIDVCTERGALKGNELFVVGQLRERFTAFIKANTPSENVDKKETEETGE